MQRHVFHHDGLRLSFLDSGGDSPVLLLLHAHWMGASDFDGVAQRLSRDWRVVALDQRGHGETSHTDRLKPADYIGDVVALLDHLGQTRPVVVLGHSLGGQVAYLLAAAHPDRVRAIIIEDTNVVRDNHDDLSLEWAGTYPTREALEHKIGARLAPYLRKSIRKTDQGWTLTFDPKEIRLSETELNGNHWGVWLATQCPALVLRAGSGQVVPGAELKEMARRRPNTLLVTVDSGHSIHIDKPEAFVATVLDFLGRLEAYEASLTATAAG